MPPMDMMEQGRMATARDPVGAQCGLWQGRNRIGAETVNEPDALVPNGLITAQPWLARDFYAQVFDFWPPSPIRSAPSSPSPPGHPERQLRLY